MNINSIPILIENWRRIAVDLEEEQTVMTANTHRLFANELEAAWTKTLLDAGALLTFRQLSMALIRNVYSKVRRLNGSGSKKSARKIIKGHGQ